MCSISGVMKYGEAPIEPEMLDQLLLALEHRGADATGIVISNPDEELWVHKDNEPAFRYVTSNGYQEFLKKHLTNETRTVLLHTRAWTKGDPKHEENNHPLYHGKCAVIHNGSIRNDDATFRELGLKRKAEVDSDVIRAIVDEYGITKEGVAALESLEGSLAGAAISQEDPGRVLLLRAGNPMIVAANQDDLFFFASTKHAIHVASRPWKQRFGVYMKPVRAALDWGTFPDQSAWLMGPKGLEWHTKFKLSWGKSVTTPARGLPLGPKPIERYLGKTLVQCLNCEAWTASKKKHAELDLDTFQCAKCDQVARVEEEQDGNPWGV